MKVQNFMFRYIYIIVNGRIDMNMKEYVTSLSEKATSWVAAIEHVIAPINSPNQSR